MRIAVPTNDGVTVSAHFGRSAGFLVFEVDGGAIRGREHRANAGQHHDHAQGACGGHGEPHQHQGHNHDGIVAALEGCDVVVCGGMGFRAAEALKEAGIAAVIAAPAGSPEDTVRAYLDGTLMLNPSGACRCSH